MLDACTLCLLLGLVRAPGESHEPPPVEDARNVEQLTFAVVGDGWIDPGDLKAALEAGLQDLGVSVAVESWPDAGTIFDRIRRGRTRPTHGRRTAVLWLEAREQGGAELYVLPPGSDLGYVRRLALPAEPIERSEAIAAVTRGVVEALEEGVPRELRVVEPPPSSAPELVSDASQRPVASPPQHDAVTPRLRFAFDLHYLGTTLSSGAPWQNGPGLELALHARPGVRVMVAGGVGFGRSRDELLPIRVIRVPLQAGVGYVHDFEVPLRIDATAVVGAERLAWSSTASHPDLEGLDGAYWRLGLGPTVGAAVRLGRGWFVRVSLGMQGWVVDQELAVEQAGTVVSVFAPHPISGRATVGIGYAFPRVGLHP